MLIRTQDRERLVDMKDMTIGIGKDTIQTDLNTCHYYNIRSVASLSALGKYSSKEKAMKVLDMIQKAYLDANHYNHSGCVMNTVFEMPADEEVEV
jgi:hypothetical protein